MNPLPYISRHSTLIMPFCAVLGFAFPTVADALLDWLPEILFFLMFFALLGINQQQLVRRLAQAAVWRFAVLQCMGFCLLAGGAAYVLGARGDLLLAVAAAGATAPLFGSAVMVQAVGFDPLEAMAQTIAATLIMPWPLWAVLQWLAADGAALNLWLYGQRLLVYILGPIALAVVVRRILPGGVLGRYYPVVGQFNILLLLTFPVGLMGGYRHFCDHNPAAALWFLGLGCMLVLLFYFGAYCCYRRYGDAVAIPAALVCGGRNLLLAYTITTPFMGSLFLPLIGAMQLPVFSLPFVGKIMARRHCAARARQASSGL